MYPFFLIEGVILNALTYHLQLLHQERFFSPSYNIA